MNLDQLEAFASVASLGGFTKASAHLHRSQPAISRRVALLEDSLGAALFERRGKDIALTAQGQVFLRHVEVALAEIKDGIAEVHDTLDAQSQTVPIGIAVVGTLADSRLTKALNRFRKQYEKTEVVLRTATSHEVSHLVISGEADVGIRYFDDNSPRLTTEYLGTERLAFVVGAASPLAGKVIRDPQHFGEAPILSFPADSRHSDSFGNMLQRELLAMGLADPKLNYIDSLTAQKRLVESGYGTAFLPLSACREELSNGSLVRLVVKHKHFDPRQPVFLISRESTRRQAVNDFSKIIRQALDFPE